MRMLVAVGALIAAAPLQAGFDPREKKVAVVFEGGYETDPRDRGRPVALVAGALGVPPDVFREAFSHVHPSQNGPPSGEQARENKRALMTALGKYGVTNERLDEVSNHYRYQPQRGERWPTRPAKAFAIVQGNRIVRFEVVDGGEGMSSPPKVAVAGFPKISATVALGFDRHFERNGSIRSIDIKPILR